MVMKGSSTSPHLVERLTKIYRKIIMVSIMGILTGYVFMIACSATPTYRRWYLKSIPATTSSYFGSPGSTFLIYTFPVLLTAVLGCLFLHLGKQMGENYSIRRNCQNYKFGRWKKPMIIRGLGIVSLTEIIILIMFVAFLVWSFSYRLHTAFSEAKQHAPRNGDKLWEVKWEKSGLILGLVGNICLSFLFFPVTRASSILPIFGLTSESSIKYHMWLGNITMLLFTLHGISYISYWIFTNQIHQMLVWDVREISHMHDVSNVAGELALIFGLLLWIATYPSIRKKMFELFFYTHHLYAFFMVFYIFHLGFSFSYSVLGGFYLFLVDRYLRFLQSRQRISLISARVLPCEAVELNFCKSQGLNYTPTSMIFVQVAKISKLQWHPFTISSNSNLEMNKLSVIIKSEGTWTKQLYHLLNSSPSPSDYFDVSIEGPYGPVSTHFLRHGMLVLVSGGSGISPFISIIKEIIFLTTNNKITKAPKILLISAFKHSLDLTMLDLLPTLPSSNLELQIEAFVTREKEPPLQKPQVRTIWFNPSPLSAPLGPTLGPKSWLCLGAIISTSFILFLVLNGIVTHYYIYTIDKETNTRFSHSSEAFFYMLLCASIAVSASIGFVWNKKQREIEEKQEVNIEQIGEEKELESFPNQCVQEFTKVHYGGRPDLKKILEERDESSIGVLVCGPKSMRHEVAATCSSVSASNLHFESISYNW